MVQSVIAIPNLPAVTALSGAELLEVVQGGVSCRVTAYQLGYAGGGVGATVPAWRVTVTPTVGGQTNAQDALEWLESSLFIVGLGGVTDSTNTIIYPNSMAVTAVTRDAGGNLLTETRTDTVNSWVQTTTRDVDGYFLAQSLWVRL